MATVCQLSASRSLRRGIRFPMPAARRRPRKFSRKSKSSRPTICGATIQEINTVRKHLSAIQGGRMAAACKAPVLALVISDVTGDDPTHIASGPCAPDPTTYRDALEVLHRHGVNAPPSVREHLER